MTSHNVVELSLGGLQHRLANGANSGQLTCATGEITSNAIMILIHGLVRYLLGMILSGSISGEQLHLARSMNLGLELGPAEAKYIDGGKRAYPLLTASEIQHDVLNVLAKDLRM